MKQILVNIKYSSLDHDEYIKQLNKIVGSEPTAVTNIADSDDICFSTEKDTLELAEKLKKLSFVNFVVTANDGFTFL